MNESTGALEASIKPIISGVCNFLHIKLMTLAARVLLNRFDSLPDANPQDKYFVLSQLVVRRRSVVRINSSLKNHLHAFLTTNYPSYHKHFHRISYKTALAFYEKYPSPSTLEGVTVEELEAFMKDI